jgi:hypothetical protein
VYPTNIPRGEWAMGPWILRQWSRRIACQTAVAATAANPKGARMKNKVKDKDKGKQKKVDLGRSGSITLHLSADEKNLLIEFDVQPEGFDKTGLNDFIDALKKIRERMQR